jgi:diacylglycerol kinase (ATP)
LARAACRAKKIVCGCSFSQRGNSTQLTGRSWRGSLRRPPVIAQAPLARICSIPYSVPAFPRLPPSRIFIVKRLFSATINSLRAIGYGFRSEAALREEMIALVAGLIAAVFIAPTVAWYVAMIASLLGLLAVEFLNTAIEKLSDHVTPEHHNAIGRIKDYGSAAVFSAICLAGLTWLAALAIRCGLI